LRDRQAQTCLCPTYFCLAFFQRTSTALRASSVRSAFDTPSHRALPPRLPPLRPSATACGFFAMAVTIAYKSGHEKTLTT
jgi:hypothetical protein